MEAKNLINASFINNFIVIVTDYSTSIIYQTQFQSFRYKEESIITTMSTSDSNSIHESELDTRKFPICMLRLDFYGILSN